MRSVALLIVGLMLFAAALVPTDWQDKRFQRFLPGGQRSRESHAPTAGFSSLSIAFVLAGTVFLAAGFYLMF